MGVWLTMRAACVLAAATTAAASGGGDAAALPPKLKYSGMSYTDERYCPNITMGSDVSALSLEHLATTGTNYVAVVVTHYQTNMSSFDIHPIDEAVPCTSTPTGGCKTVRDADLRLDVQRIHRLGMKVLLKPHIDLLDDSPQHWRGNIGETFSAREWDRWFAAYEAFILHYARLAEAEGVASFAVSTELIAASKQERHWRALVPKIRNAFSGELTSAANWSPPGGPGELTDKAWWDLMDFIGCDQYYVKSEFNLIGGKFPTLDQLLAVWAPVEKQMAELHERWNKPIVFTEMGYCMGWNADCFANTGGKESHPPNATSLASGALQYEAALMAMTKHSWFEGVFWWNWNTDAAFGGTDNGCMDPKFKPTEDLLRKWYRATQPRPPPPSFSPTCLCWL